MPRRYSPRLSAGERIADAAYRDARASVARETDDAILTPRYTTDALRQMGWQRSYGAGTRYRHAFTDAFVAAWEARVTSLEGGTK